MKMLIFIICLVNINSLYAQLLSDTIPKPFYEVQKLSDGKVNKITIVESGIASFYERLELIRNARKNIEVEYFIYGVDSGSKLFTLELIKAAKRGVKVRMLIDASIAVLELDKYYARELEKFGIEVKYYNTANIYRVSSIQFRNHRKLLAVDDNFVITGGRNIENDYFDISPRYNFIDRDLLVEGPIVKTIRESFDKYFEHKISKDGKTPRKPKNILSDVKVESDKDYQRKKEKYLRDLRRYNKKTSEAELFVQETEKDIDLRDRVYEVGELMSREQRTHVCPEITYSTDLPGGNFFKRIKENYGTKYRGLRKTLNDKISTINKRIIISSPYVLNNRRSRYLMNMLMQKNVDITVYTNSLSSTDAIYIAANLYDKVFDWVRMGIKVNLHPGNFIDNTYVVDNKVKDAYWGTHSKTHVYERELEDGTIERELMVGTYNIDNRSNFYNSEMAIFCKGNDDLIDELEEKISVRMSRAYELQKNGSALDKSGKGVSIYGVSTSKLRKMKWMKIPAKLLKFLM